MLMYTLSSSYGSQVEQLCKGECRVVRRQVHSFIPTELTGSKLGHPYNIKNGKCR